MKTLRVVNPLDTDQLHLPLSVFPPFVLPVSTHPMAFSTLQTMNSSREFGHRIDIDRMCQSTNQSGFEGDTHDKLNE